MKKQVKKKTEKVTTTRKVRKPKVQKSIPEESPTQPIEEPTVETPDCITDSQRIALQEKYPQLNDDDCWGDKVFALQRSATKIGVNAEELANFISDK